MGFQFINPKGRILRIYPWVSTRIIDISVIVILLIGIVIGLIKFGIPQIRILPLPTLIIPEIQDFLKGGWLLAISQAPLTITNAILSTSLLIIVVEKKLEKLQMFKKK